MAIGVYCDNKFLLCVCVCICVCSNLVRFFFILVSFEKLKSDNNQTWVKDAIGVPSRDQRSHTKVKGHPRSSLVENVGFRYSGLL